MPRTVWSILIALALVAPVLASSPTLGTVLPRGGQRGTEVAVTFHGDRLADVRDVLFYEPGFALRSIEVVDAKQVRATIAIAADCRLGEHGLRLRSATGLSELRTFHVGALPEVQEVEPNGDFAAPQTIGLGTTANGIVTNEDVDWFAFAGTKGQRVTAEILAMRLGGAVFDPYLAILDARRFELAASDDAPLARQDGIASAILPEDGTYYVEVRESSYAGGDGFHYRLHVGTFPRPVAAYPPGGRPGETLEVHFLGDAGGEIVRTVQVPEGTGESIGLLVEDGGGVSPTPVPFRVSPLPGALEAEPNQGREKANPIAAPSAVAGVLGAPGDVDFFVFPAKAGQVFDLRILAREIRSGADPVLDVFEKGGKHLAGNDDAAGRLDSALRFQAPADGEFEVRVRDFLGRGGPTAVYRLEVAPVAPGLALSTPVFNQYTQERQAISVPRGNRFATLLSIARQDFGGAVAATFEGLPPGVTVRADTVPGHVPVVPVVFEAAPDAPPGASLAGVSGKDPASAVAGPYRHRIDLSHGQPNNAVYWSFDVTKLAIAVAEETPFRVSIVEPKAPLVQNGSMNLRLVAERKEGFAGPIRCWMLYNPPGVGSKGDVRIEPGSNEVAMPLNANGGAPPGKYGIAVIALADSGGPLWVSTQLATLEIAPPFVGMELQSASAEQGASVEVYGTVQVARPFEGEARARLVSLPPKVEADEVGLTKDSTEVRFALRVAADAPPGTHKNVFCQVVVMQDGESVTHAMGSTELRIDVPIPPKAGEPPPPPPPPAAVVAGAPPPPPPTRLELLRAEHVKKAKAEEKP